MSEEIKKQLEETDTTATTDTTTDTTTDATTDTGDVVEDRATGTDASDITDRIAKLEVSILQLTEMFTNMSASQNEIEQEQEQAQSDDTEESFEPTEEQLKEETPYLNYEY